ncbi:MAG: hypothetical protein R3Y05_00665 [bacterium]
MKKIINIIQVVLFLIIMLLLVLDWIIPNDIYNTLTIFCFSIVLALHFITEYKNKKVLAIIALIVSILCLVMGILIIIY